MSAKTFLDTNVLIYSFDEKSPAKQKIARGLISSALSNPGEAVISWQVAQEFLHAMLHKVKVPFTPDDAFRYTQSVLMPLCQVHSRPGLWVTALRLHQETGYRFYDCLIVAAAQESGAQKLLSEDLQDGRTIGGVLIENPFR